LAAGQRAHAANETLAELNTQAWIVSAAARQGILSIPEVADCDATARAARGSSFSPLRPGTEVLTLMAVSINLRCVLTYGLSALTDGWRLGLATAGQVTTPAIAN
jgi:hypothetical protein